jgi:hypothetical protein
MTDNETQTSGWGSIFRIIAKAAVIILLLNVIFAALAPQESLGRLSLYNFVIPGRQRLPYGENALESYNLSLFNIPAMFASHTVSQRKADDEFRVFIIGDSGTWGWLLENKDSLAANINQLGLVTSDGKQIIAYNLAYPIMSLTKDLMILDEAMNYDPDLIIWPVTLESFPREKQLFSPIVQNNPQRVRPIIDRYDLQLDPQDSRFVDPSFLEQTIIAQRRNLADLLRHQFYALSWASTGIDQAVPDEITLRRSDFDEDISWQDYQDPIVLTEQELAFDALAAGVSMTGAVPLLIVNEPMYISSGLNSDLRYNSFYPRWAYDQYREMVQETADANNWTYLDIWDSIAAEEFTDTPVHMTPEGTRLMAHQLSEVIQELTGP